MKTLSCVVTTLALAACLAAQTRASAPAISQIFDFSCNSSFSSCPQGFDPTLSPVRLSNGNIYGVTWWAGQGSSGNGGTVWKATPAGKVMALHTFASSSSAAFTDGENPVIGFAAGADGNLYGTTEQGGANNAGVFYKLTPSGTFTVLYNFCSLANCIDASGPIILGQDGNFYGAVRDSDVLFELTPQGVWSLVFTLSSGTFNGPLVQASGGTLYGTGTGTNLSGFVFSLTQTGVFTTLHNFGEFVPLTSNVVLASNGNLYGATGGEIFQLTPSGEFTNIHEMTPAQGLTPSFLLQGSDGNLWGLSIDGGTASNRPGTLFTLTTSGTFLSSEEFSCGTTGCNPEGMVEGSDGNFYGTAITGGSAAGRNPEGTFFKVSAGLK